MATYVRKLKDSGGNTVIPVTRADCIYYDNSTKLKDKIDGISPLSAWPVGSVIIGSVSPASTVGGTWTSWERSESVVSFYDWGNLHKETTTINNKTVLTDASVNGTRASYVNVSISGYERTA